MRIKVKGSRLLKARENASYKIAIDLVLILDLIGSDFAQSFWINHRAYTSKTNVILDYFDTKLNISGSCIGYLVFKATQFSQKLSFYC